MKSIHLPYRKVEGVIDLVRQYVTPASACDVLEYYDYPKLILDKPLWKPMIGPFMIDSIPTALPFLISGKLGVTEVIANSFQAGVKHKYSPGKAIIPSKARFREIDWQDYRIDRLSDIPITTPEYIASINRGANHLDAWRQWNSPFGQWQIHTSVYVTTGLGCPFADTTNCDARWNLDVTGNRVSVFFDLFLKTVYWQENGVNPRIRVTLPGGPYPAHATVDPSTASFVNGDVTITPASQGHWTYTFSAYVGYYTYSQQFDVDLKIKITMTIDYRNPIPETSSTNKK
ncbi:MAG: hypothetical protein HQL65_14580 [Magnetococcales bacterium]|nr:hypothetical protein [Magnetococcales bacterium]